MTMELLKEILEVEHAIATTLEAERARAARWLEDERRTIEREAQNETTRATASAAQSEAAAKEAAAEAAAAIRAEATAFAHGLHALHDERLQRLARKPIGTIVPRAHT
jgi:hypothetical protein